MRSVGKIKTTFDPAKLAFGLIKLDIPILDCRPMGYFCLPKPFDLRHNKGQAIPI
jgi:hypothetical protein